MPKRDFLAVSDFSEAEIRGLMDTAVALRGGARDGRPLEGHTLAMLFAKSSTRTRISFEVGMHQLGGHALFLSSRDLQLGRGEPLEDTARVLSRYVDGIMIRTYSHHEVVELASCATVPVINGLTDLLHPCQVLADLLTVRDEFGDWGDCIVAWVGDGNNMANSWLNAAGLLGFELRLACPEGFEPNHEIFEAAKANTGISMLVDPEEAVRGAHVVNTDVWASMGQEAEAEVRKLSFQGYTVTRDLMTLAADDAVFLHCLPAHRGEEVEPEVLEGPQSRVFERAENRLHIQKALLLALLS